ncbi:MAG: hypothetical protein IAE67_10110, partial [Candidatus Competibacteraceae bacterium]|nr:hypothetical protein [Candidatus Competibacteraceae bacterium]
MMKNFRTLLLPILFGSCQIHFAQTSQQIDINNINAQINTKGFLFNDPYNFLPGFEAPKGSGKHSIYAANLWMGNSTNLAASTYYLDSMDYNHGPLTSFGTTTPSVETQFNKVWKVTKAEIDYHIGVTTGAIIDPGYIIPQAIATWPAHGYIYGSNYSTYLAPFVDVNTNNTYNPSSGDYPRIKGDMATYIIYNDFTQHKLSGGQSIGVEIHQMAYAFGCSSSAALDNTIFVEYKIINKTANTYPNFYFGLWSDIDIGNASNEFVECDVNRSCYFQFNNNGTDANTGSSIGYGNYHPTQGVVILSGPWMDADGIDNSKTWNGSSTWSPNGIGFEDGIQDNERWGMTSFMHNNSNGLAWQANPTTASQFHNVMKSYWVDNSYLRYGGLGHATNYSIDSPSKFTYPGSSDPTRYGTSGWSYPSWDAISVGQAQADEKSIGGMGPVTFGPGHVQIIEVAYVFAQNTTTTGVQPGKDLFFQYVDQIKTLYTSGNLNCNTTNICLLYTSD